MASKAGEIRWKTESIERDKVLFISVRNDNLMIAFGYFLGYNRRILLILQDKLVLNKCKGLNMKKQLLAMALLVSRLHLLQNAADAQYRLVIHGGAGNITADRFTPEQQAEYHAGLQKAPSCW